MREIQTSHKHKLNKIKVMLTGALRHRLKSEI